eukprot:582750-Rhodomonas_salina.1
MKRRFLAERLRFISLYEDEEKEKLENTHAVTAFQNIVDTMFKSAHSYLTVHRDKAAAFGEACMCHGRDVGTCITAVPGVILRGSSMTTMKNKIILFNAFTTLNEDTQCNILRTTGRIETNDNRDFLQTILTPACFWAEDAFVRGTPSVLIKALKLYTDVLAVTLGTLDRVRMAFSDAHTRGVAVSPECKNLLAAELRMRELDTLDGVQLPTDVLMKIHTSNANTQDVASKMIEHMEKINTAYNILSGQVQASNQDKQTAYDTSIQLQNTMQVFAVNATSLVTKAIQGTNYSVHPLKQALEQTLATLRIDEAAKERLIRICPQFAIIELLTPSVSNDGQAPQVEDTVSTRTHLQDLRTLITLAYDDTIGTGKWVQLTSTDVYKQNLQEIVEYVHDTKKRMEHLHTDLRDLKLKMEAYNGTDTQPAPANTTVNTIWETYTRQINQSRCETRDAETKLAEAQSEAERQTEKHSKEIKTLREEIQNITGQLARKDSEQSRETQDIIRVKDERIHRLEHKLSETIEERDLLQDEYDALDSRKNTFQANLQTITIEKERLVTELAEIQRNEQKLNTELDQASEAFAMNTMLPQAPCGEVLCPTRQKLFQLFEDMSHARQNKPAHGPPQQVPGVLLNENPGL